LFGKFFNQLLVIVSGFGINVLTSYNLVIQNVLKCERSEPI
jgi:hypothetical protein